MNDGFRGVFSLTGFAKLEQFEGAGRLKGGESFPQLILIKQGQRPQALSFTAIPIFYHFVIKLVTASAPIQ